MKQSPGSIDAARSVEFLRDRKLAGGALPATATELRSTRSSRRTPR